MRTHPLWNPYELPSEEEIAAARAAGGEHVPETIEVVAPDPRWPGEYAAVRERVRGALGDRVLAIEHVGSTAVPGLSAKPVIDVDLTVADSADEDDWLPDLESAGFVLRVREPGWEEHRMLRGLDPTTNLHVFSAGAREPRRHVLFRDWLVAHPADRDRYGAVKREVAARGFTDAMVYNNAKAWVVYDLFERILIADPQHQHDPHPRLSPPAGVSHPLKYAVVERERRFLLARLPDGVETTRDIVDRYMTGTRLRLREVRDPDGTVTRKLSHKVRLGDGPAEVACTNLYLDEDEWDLLVTLPAAVLRKRRHLVRRDGVLVAVDQHEDGTLVAEIDDGDAPSDVVPTWLDVLADVSDDEAWTGVRLAR